MITTAPIHPAVTRTSRAIVLPHLPGSVEPGRVPAAFLLPVAARRAAASPPPPAERHGGRNDRLPGSGAFERPVAPRTAFERAPFREGGQGSLPVRPTPPIYAWPHGLSTARQPPK